MCKQIDSASANSRCEQPSLLSQDRLNYRPILISRYIFILETGIAWRLKSNSRRVASSIKTTCVLVSLMYPFWNSFDRGALVDLNEKSRSLASQPGKSFWYLRPLSPPCISVFAFFLLISVIAFLLRFGFVSVSTNGIGSEVAFNRIPFAAINISGVKLLEHRYEEAESTCSEDTER